MISAFQNNELLTQGLVADILSVSKETVRKWEKNGALASSGKNATGATCYRWCDLLRFPEAKAVTESKWVTEERIRPVRPFRSIELFAGAGGLALGLERAGFKTVALNEFDHDACTTLRRNRPEWNVIEGDVAKIDFTVFENIDFVSGGFPCQAFSYAGHRAGFEDARGTLFFEFARVIRETRPKVFLGENVRGLLTHDSGKTIETIKSVIKDIGYTLVPPQVLKAIFYRVPQKRERLAFVGIRNDLAEHLNDFKWPSYAPRVYTVRDALKKGELFDSDVSPSEGVNYTKRKAEIIARIPAGGYWRDLSDALQRELLKGSYHLEGGKTGIGRRLSWDEPSLTLTCAPAQNQTGRCHPLETRPLNVREYARIQTFPDDWQFCGSLMSQYKQIGNAVPVNLAEAVGRSLISLLNKIASDSSVFADDKDEVSVKMSFSVSKTCSSRGKPEPVQLTLFDPQGLYSVPSDVATLLGTYRKTCREWIVERNLYNYPVSESQLDSIPELLSVRRLILQRRNDSPLYFVVKGYEIVGKKELSEIGYRVGEKHSARQKYILYKLLPFLQPIPALNFSTARLIVGAGTKIMD